MGVQKKQPAQATLDGKRRKNTVERSFMDFGRGCHGLHRVMASRIEYAIAVGRQIRFEVLKPSC